MNKFKKIINSKVKGKQHLLEVPPQSFRRMQFYTTQLPAQKPVFKQRSIPILKVEFSTFSGLLIQLFTSCARSHQNNHLGIPITKIISVTQFYREGTNITDKKCKNTEVPISLEQLLQTCTGCNCTHKMQGIHMQRRHTKYPDVVYHLNLP